MPSLSVFDLLTLHGFVGDLNEEWLRRLATAGRPVFRSTGHRLFREDAPAKRFWLVHSGVVALDFHVPGRGEIVVERVGPGTVVGWSWARPPYRWRFGAVVAEDIRAVEFDENFSLFHVFFGDLITFLDNFQNLRRPFDFGTDFLRFECLNAAAFENADL